MRITVKDLAELGTGTITRVPMIHLRKNTVTLEFLTEDGRITKRHHHYGTREKAEAQYEWWRTEYEAGTRD